MISHFAKSPLCWAQSQICLLSKLTALDLTPEHVSSDKFQASAALLQYNCHQCSNFYPLFGSYQVHELSAILSASLLTSYSPVSRAQGHGIPTKLARNKQAGELERDQRQKMPPLTKREPFPWQAVHSSRPLNPHEILRKHFNDAV